MYTCAAAFVGGVEMAIPHMVGVEGEAAICPQLEPVVGQVTGEHRWSTFLEYNSRSAKEYRWAWNSLKTEAENIWISLSIEPQGV